MGNTPPEADDDEFTLIQGVRGGSVRFAELLENDFDLDGNGLSFDGFATRPSNGRLDVFSREFRYVPDDDFFGQDTFRYTVKDSRGAVSNEATITMTVVRNASPVAEDDAATTTQRKPVTIDILANDSDADGDAFLLYFGPRRRLRSSPGPFVFDESAGVMTYTPSDDGFVGDDTVEYSIEDARGAVSNPATITVTILPQPFKYFLADAATDEIVPDASNNNRFKTDAIYYGATVELPCFFTEEVPRYNFVVEFDGPLESMFLVLSGSEAREQLENYAPYTVFGDKPGAPPFIRGKQLSDGDYTLHASAYAGNKTRGDLLGEDTITFTVRQNEDCFLF